MEEKRYKTVEEMCADSEKAVYHFFPAYLKEKILQEGLLVSKDECTAKGGRNGIYVVWNDDIRVQNAIVGDQVIVNKKFKQVGNICRVKINLKEHNISAKDIAPDINRGGNSDIGASSCKIVKDIIDIKPTDIEDWNIGNSDTYGIEIYDLEGYNVEYKPEDYDAFVQCNFYPKLEWKRYDEDTDSL